MGDVWGDTDDTYRNPGCSICGKIPTRALPIRRHVGMIVLHQFVKVNAPLCRTHGVETTSAFLKKTLVQGWWGLISVFVNAFVVVSDLVVLRRYHGLSAPERRQRVANGESTEDWLYDPFKRFHYRWFGSEGWTDKVATNGFVSSDPPGWR